MKKLSVIVLVIVSLAFAAYAEAAKPKKRTRNSNRVGAYGSVMIGMTSYTSNQDDVEAFLLNSFNPATNTNIRVKTEDTDIGFQAAFGYRFTRYAAAELAFVDLGSLVSTGRADFNGSTGTVPALLELDYSTGGPVFSAVGILPLNDKIELFARGGVLFASSKRDIVQRTDGELTGFGTARGDSTNFVLALGATWHFNQVYSIRGELQQISGVGDPNTTGKEDLTIAGIGMYIRF